MKYILGLMSILIGHGAMAECTCKHTPPSWWDTGWAFTAYSGPLTSQTSSKILGDADFEGSGIVGFALGKKIFTAWENKLDFELETTIVQHFGKQDNFEIDPIAIIARWRAFPWNKTLPTTIAIGDGVSVASKKPTLELKRRGINGTAKTLNYVMAEITLSLPDYPKWALVARYHHRSGMFGTFHGVHDASTAFAAGLKYWF